MSAKKIKPKPTKMYADYVQETKERHPEEAGYYLTKKEERKEIAEVNKKIKAYKIECSPFTLMNNRKKARQNRRNKISTLLNW